MTIYLRFSISFTLLLIFSSCGSETRSHEKNTMAHPASQVGANLLTDVIPTYDDGDVNAVIEIPAGTLEKWELNKSTGRAELELIGGKARIINYLGYPGNYGMIPQTLLSKEHGGDGDPLDIVVLGPPVKRDSVVKCKVIGVLHLLDGGEQDDKLVGVSANSPLYGVSDVEELRERYHGVLDILELWFTNYKGKGIMESKGFGDKESAMDILEAAIGEYQSAITGHTNK